jgi:hypothetical protein
MKLTLSLVMVLALAAGAADAAVCKDGHGKFIKCPPPRIVRMGPMCRPGNKPCGGICIPEHKFCHR